MTNRRSSTAMIIGALSAVALAACSSPTNNASPQRQPSQSTASAVQPAARGVEAPAASIPWRQVGPGWLLATWTPAVSHMPGVPLAPGEPERATSSTKLYLVDPVGGRYLITTFGPPGDKAGPELVDWSADGSQALFYTPGAHQPNTLVDLHTGAQTQLTVDGHARFSGPDGKALLVTKQVDTSGRSSLVRVDLNGDRQLNYRTENMTGKFTGSYLTTPDGTRLVLGTSAGMALIGNDGTAGPSLPVSGQSGCDPVRWWDDQSDPVVVAVCDSSEHKGKSLWAVPINGGAPTALTKPNDGQSGPDYGDMDAWKLPSGTFVQAQGACGVVFLAKINADGSTTKVDVPNTEGSVGVIGTNGGHLYLHAMTGCGGGKSLLDYDPAANTSTVLLGPPVIDGGVTDVLLYHGRPQ
ncbi:hypothetical protein [Mycobacterium sp. 1081908.1]|uniref:TolB family protein n=1 Tax=Mycobacterium sp. 1081908.1 TaxID=1834066 RepID=UPI0007FC1872|nr:hypothetical protein [Mycobacterium sp. 1081908.1]OBK52830.1 hypothetical protein A5655_20940 [Mycobacterium sp. 1081908.1]